MWKFQDPFAEVREARALYNLGFNALIAAENDYRFRTAIWGSARALPGKGTMYEDARRLGRELATNGIDVVTGGGPGIMEAANLGAREARARAYSVGCSLMLPQEQPNQYLQHDFQSEDFAERLRLFGFLACGFVVMPGGLGSMLEMAWIAQHVQILRQMGGLETHGHLYPKNISVQLGYKPLLLIVGRQLWSPLIDLLENMVDEELVSPQDVEIFQLVDSGEEAAARMIAEKAKWREFIRSKGKKPR